MRAQTALHIVSFADGVRAADARADARADHTPTRSLCIFPSSERALKHTLRVRAQLRSDVYSDVDVHATTSTAHALGMCGGPVPKRSCERVQ